MSPRSVLGLLLAFLLLLSLACGAAEEATPTPTITPTSIPALPSLVVPTPTATATPVPTPRPGVTAVPTPTSTPSPTPIPKEQPVYGGRIVAMDYSTAIFDPYHGQTGYGYSPGSLAGIGNVFSTLLRVSPIDKVTVEGDLAVSWSVSADGTVWKLKMRPGVVDHAGNPYTVEDAYYAAYRYIQRPNGVAANRLSCFRVFLKPLLDKDGKAIPAPGVEITGADELTLRLVAPRGAFTNCFAGGWAAWLPDTYIKKIDADTVTKYRDLDFSKGEAIGTGPFKVVGYERDNFVKLARFDQYFRKGMPYLDGYDVYVIPDPSTRVAMFKVGRADIFPFTPAATPSMRDMERLKAEVGAEVIVPRMASVGWAGFEINLNRPALGPLGDPKAQKVRTSIQMRIDRQELNELTEDGVGFFSTPYFIGDEWIYTKEQWYKNLIGLDPDPKKKAQDIVNAQKLMQEAGYGPNNRLPLNLLGTVQYKARSEVLASQLKDIYIDVTPALASDSALEREKALRGEFDLRMESKGATFVDPDAFNVSIFPAFKDGGFTFGGWDNPRWKQLLEQELALDSMEKRAPLLREMATIMWNDAAWIGEIRPAALPAYRSNWRGWTSPLHNSGNFTFEHLWLAPKK